MAFDTSMYRKKKQNEDDPSSTKSLYTDDGPAAAAYREHVKAMPQEEDYQPGIGRRIVGSLAGALTAFGGGAKQGMDVTDQITKGRYRDALTKYDREGGALKEQANIEDRGVDKKIKFIREESDRKDKEADNTRKDAELGVKKADLERKLNKDMNDAKTNEEKIAATKAYHEGMLSIMGRNAESNASRAESAGVVASAAASRAETYAKGRGKKETKPKHISTSEQGHADRMAVDKALAENPDYEKFVARDDKGKISGFQTDKKGTIFGRNDFSPEEKEQYRNFQRTIEKHKRKILGKTFTPVDDDKEPSVDGPEEE